MSSKVPLPLPVPNPDNQGFWEACKRHELVIQQCSRCKTFRHPPRPTCYKCHCSEYGWQRVSGSGTVYTYTVTHQPVHPALADKVPWTVVIVELKEGIRMVSHLVDCPPDQVRIGMPVEVTFEDVTEDVSLPYFRPADTSESPEC